MTHLKVDLIYPSETLLASIGWRGLHLAWILIFLGVSIAVRLLWTDLGITPDSEFFRVLALNIVQNGCYSTSDVFAASCEPSWGSQPPGYVLFLAVLTIVPGSLFKIAAIVQTVLFAIATTYALLASYAWHRSRSLLIVSAFVTCLSPASIPWSQWVLSETLAAAAAVWLFAELFRSLADRKMRVIPVGLALVAATAFRWDMILLLVPMLILAVHLGGIKKGIGNWIRSGIPTAVFLLTLIFRAWVVGLPLIPGVLSDPSLPPGVVKFWKDGAVRQAATSQFLWPIWDRNYGSIQDRLDLSSFHVSFVTPELTELIKQIDELQDGQTVPPMLDAQLYSLAERGASSSLYNYPLLVLKRASLLWSGRDCIFFSGWGWGSCSSDSKGSFVSQADGISRLYRCALLLLCFVAASLARGSAFVLASGVLLFCISRSVFLAMLTALEIRYVAPMIPPLEIVSVIIIGVMLQSKRTDRSMPKEVAIQS